MSDEPAVAVAEPLSEVVVTSRPKPKRDQKRKRQPRYHVLLWNDDDHSFEYVIGMMEKLFAMQPEEGFKIAQEVHLRGKAICLTTTRELAELKRDQIHAFGKDKLIASCKGSMSSTIEPEM